MPESRSPDSCNLCSGPGERNTSCKCRRKSEQLAIKSIANGEPDWVAFCRALYTRATVEIDDIYAVAGKRMLGPVHRVHGLLTNLTNTIPAVIEQLQVDCESLRRENADLKVRLRFAVDGGLQLAETMTNAVDAMKRSNSDKQHESTNRPAKAMAPKLCPVTTLAIPLVLEHEHEKMRQGLKVAAANSGVIGEAATRLAALCFPHFEVEERMVFPALATLYDLSSRHAPEEESARVKREIDGLSRRNKEFHKEHESIGIEVDRLLQFAQDADDRQAMDLAYILKSHERVERGSVFPLLV
jgi:hypothetical protein